jgi:glycosyltransferase involved in cell wall biosynthesis
MQPLVSICIPVYNGEAYLNECIRSAMEQTYKNIEIVLIDDGSTDSSIKIAEELLVDFLRKIIHKNETNLGLVANWRKSIELANGEWIKFHFQDDLMEADCIEIMLTQAISLHVPFVFSARKFIFDQNISDKVKNKYLVELKKPEEIFADKKRFEPKDIAHLITPFLSQNIIGEPVCWLVQKDLIKSAGGFNEGLKMFVDYEFALRIVLNHPSVFIRRELVLFRVHQTSTSIKHETAKQSKALRIKEVSASADILKLINLYVSDLRLSAFLKHWGMYKLKVYFIYFYYRLCKQNGRECVQDILGGIPELSIWVKKLSYSRLKYEYYKLLFNWLVRPHLNKI